MYAGNDVGEQLKWLKRLYTFLRKVSGAAIGGLWGDAVVRRAVDDCVAWKTVCAGCRGGMRGFAGWVARDLGEGVEVWFRTEETM